MIQAFTIIFDASIIYELPIYYNRKNIEKDRGGRSNLWQTSVKKGNFQGNTVQFDAADRALHQQKFLILKPFLDVLKKLLLQMRAAVIEEKKSQCIN